MVKILTISDIAKIIMLKPISKAISFKTKYNPKYCEN